MNEPDLIRLIKQIVRSELTPINMASVVATKDQLRVSMQRFSSEAEVPNLRNIQPYGFASRPKAGMDAMVAPVKGDPTHMNMIGQFDKDRPAIDDGEAALYGPDGQIVLMKAGGDMEFKDSVTASKKRMVLQADGTVYIGLDKQVSTTPDKKVFLGSPSADEPAVLGNVLKDALSQIISQLNSIVSTVSSGPIGIISSPVPGSPVPTSPGVIASLALVTAQLTLIQSQFLDTSSSNILSQQVFVERQP